MEINSTTSPLAPRNCTRQTNQRIGLVALHGNSHAVFFTRLQLKGHSETRFHHLGPLHPRKKLHKGAVQVRMTTTKLTSIILRSITYPSITW